jgi:S-adenosyl-L-methionine hydrolase (adenosine-forming)
MIVTLLTDFGTADGYVAEVKGALLRGAPGATLVDVTHEIPPGDVAAAAYVLGRSWRAFPAGTVHVVVVDPGVGTDRRALAAEAGGHRFVAPDNGVLSRVLEAGGAYVVSLAMDAAASPTFHGRDVFAPAAARLLAGEPLEALGAAVRDPVLLPAPRLERRGDILVGEVVHVDRFGTLVTSLPGSSVGTRGTVRIGDHEVAFGRTFADAAPGAPVAFVGSGGTVEVAVRDGRADAVLGAGRGDEVRATARDAGPS